MKDVCFIGDGVVMGLGDEAFSGWPGRLCALEAAEGRHVRPSNLGVSGDTSRSILRRWRSEAEARLTEADQAGLVFSFGLWDMADRAGDGIRVPLMESMANAEVLVTEAAEAWPVLWVGPAPIRPQSAPIASHGAWDRFSMARLEGLNAAYRDIAGRAGVPYLDLIESLRADARWRASLAAGNGIFPTGEGHARVADLMHRWAPWQAWMRGGLRRLPPPEPPRLSAVG